MKANPRNPVMSDLSKRSTIYFDPVIHQALRMRAASAQISVSELVDEAVRLMMREDREDLAAFELRAAEPAMTYEALLADLKANGKL